MRISGTFERSDTRLLRMLGAIAEKRKTRTFLVGGPVRDVLLGHPSPDIDIAVANDCRGFGRAVARETNGRFVYHPRFLTGTVLLHRQEASVHEPRPGITDHIDVGRTRTETYPGPAVLPRVRPAEIRDDLGRRDFGINAMALELTRGKSGSLLDPHNGRADIANRRVRVLHQLSFVDDPTRAFRAIRFAVRLGFEIEPETLRLMRDCIEQGYPALLTPERILYELRLICTEPKAAQIFEALLKERLLQACFREDPGFAIHTARFLSGLQRLNRTGAGAELRYLFVLAHLPLTDRFPITREERDSVGAVRCFPGIRSRLLKSKTPGTTYRLLRHIPFPALRLLSVMEPDRVRSRIVLYLNNLAQVKIRTTGSDLQRMGLAPGPEYRRILDRVLCARIDGRVQTPEEEQRLVGSLVRRALLRSGRKRKQTREEPRDV